MHVASCFPCSPSTQVMQWGPLCPSPSMNSESKDLVRNQANYLVLLVVPHCLDPSSKHREDDNAYQRYGYGVANGYLQIRDTHACHALWKDACYPAFSLTFSKRPRFPNTPFQSGLGRIQR